MNTYFRTYASLILIKPYSIIAINADNLSANKVVYVATTGGVDILAYSATILLLRFIGRKWACMWWYGLAGLCMLLLIVIPIESTAWIVIVAMMGRFFVTAVYGIITLYTTELFPTEIRTSAVGASSTCGHVGSMIAPFVVDLLVNKFLSVSIYCDSCYKIDTPT